MKDKVKSEASVLMNIVWSSAMGDNWHPFIKARSMQICDKIIKVLDKIPDSETARTFYKEVKKYIEKT